MQIKKTITGVEPITLSEAKLHLKADYNDEDSLISLLISSVRESLEKFTGLSLIASQIVYFDEEIEDEIKLPYPEHDAISEVKLNGEVSTSYTKTGLTQFIISPLATYVSTAISERGIKVTYTTTGNCPEGLKVCMLKAIDEAYRNRGNTFEGSITDLSENTYSNAAKYCVV